MSNIYYFYLKLIIEIWGILNTGIKVRIKEFIKKNKGSGYYICSLEIHLDFLDYIQNFVILELLSDTFEYFMIFTKSSADKKTIKINREKQ